MLLHPPYRLRGLDPLSDPGAVAQRLILTTQKDGMTKPALSLGAALLLLAGPLAAQSARAEEPVALQLGYDGRFYIKVLEMTLDQAIGADSYRTNTHIRTWGLAAVVKKLDQRASATGRIDGTRTLPETFTHQNKDGRRDRRVTTRWNAGDVVTTAVPAYDNMGEPPASRTQKLGAADPLTQLVRITRASTARGPCSGDTNFFDGKQLYDFDFTRPRPGGDPSSREQGLGLTNPVICEVTYREVAGFRRKPPEDRSQGLKGVIQARFGQLGADGPWVLSSLQADTRWGRAMIDLRRLMVNGEPVV